MKKFINIIIGIVLLIMCVMNCFLANRLADKTEELIELTNLEPEIIFLDSLVWDTVYFEKTEVVRLPIVDTIITTDTIVAVERDSVFVEVPINTYHYDTTLAETHINLILEGFDVRLNSLLIENLKVPTIEQKPLKTKPFGIGVQLGIGATKDGFSPYIGLGLNYNIYQF